MKITEVEITCLTFDLEVPYQIAYESYSQVQNVFLRIGTGSLNGWGCAAPDPFVTGETVEAVFEKAKDILPVFLKGQDPFRRAKIMAELKKTCPGLPSLWTAVDTALWDLMGKKAGLPVWKLLGGYRERIETSVTIGIETLEDTVQRARELRSQGFRIFKIKGGLDAKEDLERLKALRQIFGKDIHLRFDVNQGFSVDQALTFIKGARELQLQLIEQPTHQGKPELLGLVTRKSPIPIMADESLVSLLDAFLLAKKGLVDLMNIKLMKVGGVTEAIQVDGVARSAGLQVMVGCMDESALGISAGLHFALSRKNIRYADLDGHLDLLEDPSAGAIRIHRGFLYPSTRPGFGWDGW